MSNVTYKLYQVTFTDGTLARIRASNPHRASLAVSRNHGTDIASMEILAVDVPADSLPLPAKTLARVAMTPASNVRIASASSQCVTLRMGGAY